MDDKAAGCKMIVCRGLWVTICLEIVELPTTIGSRGSVCHTMRLRLAGLGAGQQYDMLCLMIVWPGGKTTQGTINGVQACFFSRHSLLYPLNRDSANVYHSPSTPLILETSFGHRPALVDRLCESLNPAAWITGGICQGQGRDLGPSTH